MMKLLSNPLSPYGRKVKIAMGLKGLKDRIEIVQVDTNPADNPIINKPNPLAKIPALVIEDNTAIYDSHVICEYLDSLSPSPVLFPKTGVERIKTLTLGALADGILDAALLLVYEKRFRPEAIWHAPWQERQQGKIDRALEPSGTSAAGLGRKSRLRSPDARLRARLPRFPPRGQMAPCPSQARGLARQIRRRRAGLRGNAAEVIVSLSRVRGAAGCAPFPALSLSKGAGSPVAAYNAVVRRTHHWDIVCGFA